jgi:hypothetical protein
LANISRSRADRLDTDPGLVARRLRQPPKDWTQADLTVSGEGAYSPHETAQFAGPSVMPLGTWLLGTVLATFVIAWVWWSLSRVVAPSPTGRDRYDDAARGRVV